MGWSKDIVENKVRGMTKRFWNDMAKLLLAESEDEWDDTFGETVRWARDSGDGVAAAMVKDAAWETEGEHLGGWLDDPKFAPLYKKHKLSGRIVFTENGDVMGLTAYIFEDGVCYYGEEHTTWSKGAEIG